MFSFSSEALSALLRMIASGCDNTESQTIADITEMRDPKIKNLLSADAYHGPGVLLLAITCSVLPRSYGYAC